MRSIRIYQAGAYQPGQTLALSETAAQHVGPVLRLTVGEVITLFCGDNHEYQATLCEVHKKRVRVHIDSKTEVNRESPRAIHLAQAIAKGDKMEWMIQKSVELGVTSITPLLTERCVVRLDSERLLKKQQQWQAIAIAACEQSGRNVVPMIHPATTLEPFLLSNTTSITFTLSPHTEASWPTIKAHDTLSLIVGPEGGLSPSEVALSIQHHAHPVRLGPRILRTETAAMTALGLLQMRYGDLSSV